MFYRTCRNLVPFSAGPGGLQTWVSQCMLRKGPCWGTLNFSAPHRGHRLFWHLLVPQRHVPSAPSFVPGLHLWDHVCQQAPLLDRLMSCLGGHPDVNPTWVLVAAWRTRKKVAPLQFDCTRTRILQGSSDLTTDSYPGEWTSNPFRGHTRHVWHLSGQKPTPLLFVGDPPLRCTVGSTWLRHRHLQVYRKTLPGP